jgi:hypothetical protein
LCGFKNSSGFVFLKTKIKSASQNNSWKNKLKSKGLNMIENVKYELFPKTDLIENSLFWLMLNEKNK